jgi:hypothetical protein
MTDQGHESGGCLCGAVRYDFDRSSVVVLSSFVCEIAGEGLELSKA